MAVTLRKVTDPKINTERPAFVNFPTLVKGAGTVTDGRTDAPAPDYSDGYGSTYAKGE